MPAPKGNTFWLGRKHSEETKLKLSIQRLGKKLGPRGPNKKQLSNETKLKMSLSKIGSKNSFYGKKHTEETIIKLRIVHKATSKRGKDNHWWKGGITTEYILARNSIETIRWRILVFERDNYTCQICGDNKGHNLNAHHVKSFKNYPELRYILSNGLTVCIRCHRLIKEIK